MAFESVQDILKAEALAAQLVADAQVNGEKLLEETKGAGKVLMAEAEAKAAAQTALLKTETEAKIRKAEEEALAAVAKEKQRLDELVNRRMDITAKEIAERIVMR